MEPDDGPSEPAKKAPDAGAREVPGAARPGTPWGAMAGATILVFLVGFGFLRYGANQGDARRAIRHCWSNLKTLNGAMELWKLDGHEPLEPLAPAAIQGFVDEGYLAQLPWDPGYGEPGVSHYRVARDGWAMCIRHGTFEQAEPELWDRPRELVRALGGDAALQAQAAAHPMDNVGLVPDFAGFGELISLALLAIVSPILGPFLAVAWHRLRSR